jgi:uncharacterized membrane protein
MSLSRPLLIGLIASAALNVFLIGGVAGVTWVRLSSPPAPAQPVVASAVPAPPAGRPLSPPEDPVAATPPISPRPAAAPRPPVEAAPVPSPGERLARPPLWSAGDQLSPQSRKALRLALRAANQKNQPITRQARAERRAALEALNTPNYDPAEVSRRLARARDLDIQARANVEAGLASYASTLSPQERAVLAEGLSRIYAPRRSGERPGEE